MNFESTPKTKILSKTHKVIVFFVFYCAGFLFRIDLLNL